MMVKPPEDWTEKYRPKTLAEVIGNPKAISELRKWADLWERGTPDKRGAILFGCSGIGKTSAAFALANDYGWSVVELNASDARNATVIRAIATRGAIYESFTPEGEYVSTRTGGRKLILLDEADHLYERITGEPSAEVDVSDRGGKRAIIEMLGMTLQPVILIVNDYYALVKDAGEPLKHLCVSIEFSNISIAAVKSILTRICSQERIRIAPEAIDALIEHAAGDLRSAINDLQALAAGTKNIRVEDVQMLGYRDVGYRDTRNPIFKAVRDVLQTKNLIKARTAFEKLNESPEFMVLWVDENLPIEYEDPEDLEKGYNILSKADIFLRRVKRRQYYRFWAYASDLMSSGVALAKKRPHTIFKRYQFPSWLLKMSRSKNIRNMQNSVLSKVGEYCHVSKQFLRESDLFYTFKYLFKSDVEFAAAMIASLELTKDDIAYLIDEPPDAHVVKFLQDAAIEQQTSKTVKLAPGKGEAVLGDFEGKRPGRRRKWKKVDRDYEGEEEEEDEEVRSKRREKKGEEQKRLFEF